MKATRICGYRFVETLLALLIVALCSGAGRAADLILVFAGQSNMESKGTTNTASKLTAKEKAPIPNVRGSIAMPCRRRASPTRGG